MQGDVVGWRRPVYCVRMHPNTHKEYSMPERYQCPTCLVYTNNPDHVCVEYNGPTCATPGCDLPTVFVVVGAPGTGSGYVCKDNHYHGTCRELTVADVV